MGSCFGNSKNDSFIETTKLEKPNQPMTQIANPQKQTVPEQIQIKSIAVQYGFPVLFSTYSTLNPKNDFKNNSEEFVSLSPNLKATYHLDIKLENDDYSYLKKYLVIIYMVDIGIEKSVNLLQELLKLHKEKQCKSKFVIIILDNSQIIEKFQQSISSNYPGAIFQISKTLTLAEFQLIISTSFTEIANKILNFTFIPDTQQLQEFVFAQQYSYYQGILSSYPSGLCSLPLHYGDIFFRCYDCELYTHESIFVLFCENCFRNGEHKNHRISIRYQKDDGVHGCCDCGDTAAFNENSFCKNHRGQQLQKEVFKDFGGDVYARLLGVIQKGVESVFDKNAQEKAILNLNSLMDFIEELIQETPAMKMIISALLMEEKSILGTESNAIEVLFKQQQLINQKHQDQLQALFIELFINKEFKKYLAKLYGKYLKKTFKLKIASYKENFPLQITFPQPMSVDASELKKLIAPIQISNKIDIQPCSKFSSLITQFLSPDISNVLMQSDYLKNYLKIFQKVVILTYTIQTLEDTIKQSCQYFFEYFFFQLDTISTKRMVLKSTEILLFISQFIRIIGKMKFLSVKNVELHTYVEFLALKDFNEYLFCQIEIDGESQKQIETFERLVSEIFVYFELFYTQIKAIIIPFSLVRVFSILIVHYINLFGYAKVIEIIKKIIPPEQLTRICTQLFEHLFLINVSNYIMRSSSMKTQQEEIIEILIKKYGGRFNIAFIQEGFPENYDICFIQFCFQILAPMSLLQLMADNLKIFEKTKQAVFMMQTWLEMIILYNLEQLAFLNCLCYPDDHPYTESNISSMKFLLANLLFSQQNQLQIENIEKIGRRIFKFDMDYSFFLEQLTTMNKESKTLMMKEQYLQEIEPMQWLRFNFIQSAMYEELELKVKKNQEKFDLILTIGAEKFVDKSQLNWLMGYKIYSNQEFFTFWQIVFNQLFEEQQQTNQEENKTTFTQIIPKVLKVQSLILTCFEINNEVIANDCLIVLSNQLKAIQQLMSKKENQEATTDYKQTVHKLQIKVEKLNQFNQSIIKIQDFSSEKKEVQKNYLKKQQDILKQFQMKQIKFCEQNDEIKQEINSTEILEIQCTICHEGNTKEQLDNLQNFYSSEYTIKDKGEDDLEASQGSLNWIMTTCNHFNHSECAQTNKENYSHMIRNEAERVCSLCKSLFNILLPIISEEFELKVTEVNEQQRVKSYSIEELQKLLSDTQFLQAQQQIVQEQTNYNNLSEKIKWFKDSIESIILINITELNADGYIEIELPSESPFIKNIKQCLLFQFNQMFVKGVNLYLRNHHFFIRNLFLCYCMLFQPFNEHLAASMLDELNEKITQLKTGQFLQLSLTKYEQFISSILIDIGMLCLCNKQLYYQSIGLIYHLFIYHLNQVYKSQLESSDLQGIAIENQLQNYLLPFKRQILGVILCCSKFDNKIIQEIANLELMTPLDEASKYDSIFNTLFTIPTLTLASPCKIASQMLSCNPCKQPSLPVQLSEIFLDFHFNFLLKRCMLCDFYSKKNMGELYICLLCGLRFCSSCGESKYILESMKSQDQVLFAHASVVHLGAAMFVNCQTGKLNLVDRKQVFEYGSSLYVNSCGAPIKVFTNQKNWELFKLDTKRMNLYEHIAFSRKITQYFGQEISEKHPQECRIF